MSRSSQFSSLAAALAAFLVATGCGTDAPPAVEAAAAPFSGPQTAIVPIDPHLTHRVNAGANCNDCHCRGGHCTSPTVFLLAFADVAVAPGRPPPSFDLATQTCSNVACHMVPAGTYRYWNVGGDGELAENQVSFGGVPVTTPPWDSAASGDCRACHAAPPNPSAGAWHSGSHGGGSPAMNDCSLCHPHVVRVNGVLEFSTASTCGPGGTTGSCAALHRNGRVDVLPRWRSSCFGCH